jgi:ketosteroid isomerase-like protein
MINKIPFLLAIFLLLSACRTTTEKGSVDLWKKEILETEKNFSQMAKDKGVPEAFKYFAAEDVVLQRNNQLVIGKSELIAFYENQGGEDKGASLTWKPDFVDVAASGDLGYTYGQYTYSYPDSTGMRIENKGVFHTVWKRQADGSWRFVWD